MRCARTFLHRPVIEFSAFWNCIFRQSAAFLRHLSSTKSSGLPSRGVIEAIRGFRGRSASQSTPILFRLAPHGGRRRVLDLEPLIDAAEAVGRAKAFRVDAFAAEGAGVLEIAAPSPS